MADSDTLTKTREETALGIPWNVVVHDDNVNAAEYIVWVFMKIFGFDENTATMLMLKIENLGRSVVWTGEREKAEFYTQQLQAHQLRTTLEKAA